MRFPTANDSLPYGPINIIDRSLVRTDLWSRWPSDGFQYVDDAQRHPTVPVRRTSALRVAALVGAVLVAVAATSAVIRPADGLPATLDLRVAPTDLRVAPTDGQPASPFLD